MVKGVFMYSKWGIKLKELLDIEKEPVAIKWSTKIPRNIQKEEGTSRFCKKLENASSGDVFYFTAEEEECMGGARYSGLKDIKEFPSNMRSGAFLVGMGVYKNVSAVQRSWNDNKQMESGIFKAILFAPLIKAEFEPDVIFIICKAKQGMEILHANAYDSGIHGLGADSGPICSTMAALPYLTGKVTYGFGDIGARNNTNLNPEDVMLSIPAADLPRIISNLKEMRTKRMFRSN